MTADGAHQLPQQCHGHPPTPAHLIAPIVDEAATDDHVSVVEGSEERRDLSGVVLAVGVELVGPVEALAHGMSEAQAEGAADAQVEGEAEAGGTAVHRGEVRTVSGSVVDHDHVVVRDVGGKVG